MRHMTEQRTIPSPTTSAASDYQQPDDGERSGTKLDVGTASALAKSARPGKRGNNEGSITRRSDGRWQARVTQENGKRKSLYGATRQEVAQWPTAALRQRDQGLPLVEEKQTVAQ